MMDRMTIDDKIAAGLPPVRKNIADKGFSNRLKKALSEVNQLQIEADEAMEQVTKGTMGIHEGMLVISKADISLRLLLQVRNKVMEAYREISRMAF
ncbi:MAG: flagellar hook-basal body complex protein FliE [Deltaproteobacteria bacterium]|nr:flagellar hook-basal body complex protein FliE [Deltaproteobacteria bacterium]MBW2151754.1 flagellar hook-basal body complex protein FliE [Deltaproteobacteria bacterium]